MNNRSKSPSPFLWMRHTLAAVAALTLAVSAWGQTPAAVDLETAASLHERDSWPAGALLRGVELPDEIPGLELATGPEAEVEILAEQGFERNGDDLLSIRTLRVVERGDGQGLRLVLQLEVLVADSQRAAQDAMLVHVARTHSVMSVQDPRRWTREPLVDESSSDASAWSGLGDVRIGLPLPGGIARIVFTRGNVLVKVMAEATESALVLPVALAVDRLVAASPGRAADDDAVTGIQIATPVAWRATAPVAIDRVGDGELSFDFRVTGGMVTADEAGGDARVYYAGDVGEHTVEVLAADAFGFPSRAQTTCEVLEE